MRADKRGLTFVELMVSLALFGTMLTTVYGSLTVGQAAFWTNEASLQAQQTARNALDVIEQDLAGSYYTSWYGANGTGNGKQYIQFQRINQNLVHDADGTTWWDVPSHTYVWCPQGSATPGDIWEPNGTSVNLCTDPVAPPAGQLRLIMSPTLGAPWQLERVVIAQGVTKFEAKAMQANGQPMPEADKACGTRVASTGCASPPFGTNVWPAYVEITLTTSPTTPTGRQVPITVHGRVKLRSPQK